MYVVIKLLKPKPHILNSRGVMLKPSWIFLAAYIVLGTACQQASLGTNVDSTPGVLPTALPDSVDSDTPRLIAYYNANTHPILKDADQQLYTHYILSFLIPDGKGGVTPSGPLRAVLADSKALNRVQAAGKKIMVAVGGGTVTGDDWLTLGNNAESVAESIAKIVEQHNLDGVDLDIEAVPFMKQSEFQPYADAAIALTRALAKRLPGKYLTHAPQPPYLCKPGSSGQSGLKLVEIII